MSTYSGNLYNARRFSEWEGQPNDRHGLSGLKEGDVVVRPHVTTRGRC
eukprot:COSAG04_NODE_14763_length_556_cov_0.647702_1_plen_48_part_00